MSTVLLQIMEREIPVLPNSVVEIIAELEDPDAVDSQALISKLSVCGNLSSIIVIGMEIECHEGKCGKNSIPSLYLWSCSGTLRKGC